MGQALKIWQEPYHIGTELSKHFLVNCHVAICHLSNSFRLVSFISCQLHPSHFSDGWVGIMYVHYAKKKNNLKLYQHKKSPKKHRPCLTTRLGVSWSQTDLLSPLSLCFDTGIYILPQFYISSFCIQPLWHWLYFSTLAVRSKPTWWYGPLRVSAHFSGDRWQRPKSNESLSYFFTVCLCLSPVHAHSPELPVTVAFQTPSSLSLSVLTCDFYPAVCPNLWTTERRWKSNL